MSVLNKTASTLPGSSALYPVALTVAGSDSGGGAGIQADLRAFAFFDVFGTTAVTAVTAQNPERVDDVFPVSPENVSSQIEAVTRAFAVKAAKTGMLFSSEIVRAVAHALGRHADVPLVVDPVVVAGSGARLLREEATATLVSELLPKAACITPNIPEAEILLGRGIADAGRAARAAQELAARFGCLVVVKGGHRAVTPASDFVSDGKLCWKLETDVADARAAHGTGCTLSAAVAAELAQRVDPLNAVIRAKAYVYQSLCNSIQVGRRTWAMTPPDTLAEHCVTCTEL